MPERRDKDKMNFNEVAVWPGPGPADPQSELERIPSLEPEANLAALWLTLRLTILEEREAHLPSRTLAPRTPSPRKEPLKQHCRR